MSRPALRFCSVALLAALTWASIAPARPTAAARPIRQLEQLRQQQRTLPAAQIRQLAVDGWGHVTVTGTATDRITATATLRAWAASPDEAAALLDRLRWYLDPAGAGTVRAGASGPSQPDAVQYRGRRYGKQARVDLALTVPEHLTLQVTTAAGDVMLRHLAGATVRVDGGSIRLEQINGAVDAEAKAGAISGIRLGGRTWLVSGNGKLSVAGVGGKLMCRTVGGAIDARDVRGDAALATRTGRIVAVSVDGALQAETGTGAIQATLVRGACDLQTTYGRISGQRLMGPAVVARTGSGAIHLEQPHRRETRYDLRSAQGPIEIGIDPGASLAVTLTSGLGRVETNLPLSVSNGSPRGRDPHRLLGSLNGGRLPLRAVSDSGGILLRAARY